MLILFVAERSKHELLYLHLAEYQRHEQNPTHTKMSLLTLGACASEGYGSWVCLSVCLSGENKLLCSLTPVINSGYSMYMTNSRFKTCGFCSKMHGSKVMTINTFHGDPRPSLWR